MTALALELCCTLMADKRSSKNISMAVTSKVLPQALTLIKSSLLQGQALLVILCFCCSIYFISIINVSEPVTLNWALQALQKFFATLVDSSNTNFDTLLESLLSSVNSSTSSSIVKQALYSIAQCVAVLCLAAGDEKCSSTVKMLTEILEDNNSRSSVSISFLILSKIISCFCFVSSVK